MDQQTGTDILGQLLLLNAMGSAVCWAGLACASVVMLVLGLHTVKTVW